MQDNVAQPILGYLSGAPRVSTRPDAELAGPRSHVLGVIRGFTHLGWAVRPFIVGDQVPQSIASRDSAHVQQGVTRKLMADLARVAMGIVNQRRAWRELGGRVDWVYERLAIFQALGEAFQRRGVPWILETNAPLAFEAKADRKSIVLDNIARRLEMRAYRKCDVLVCISQELKDLLVQEAGLDPGKVVVVPNATDPELFIPNKNRTSDGPLKIGFAGTIFPWQGLDCLLKALHEISLELPDWRLVIVGDGPCEQSCRSLATQLDLGSRVQFAGRMTQSEFVPLIASCDLAYLGYFGTKTGVAYGSSLKLYEYMAMGLPILACAVGDAARILHDGENGFLFKPDDIGSLKAALRRAAQRRRDLSRIGDSARQEVVRKHTWTARVATMMDSIAARIAPPLGASRIVRGPRASDDWTGLHH